MGMDTVLEAAKSETADLATTSESEKTDISYAPQAFTREGRVD